MPPTPEEIAAATTLADRLFDIGKWIVGVGILVMGWVWRASKEHSKLQDISTKIEGVNHGLMETRADVEGFVERVERDYLTRSSHKELQRACQEHISRVSSDKLHEVVKEIRETNLSALKEMREAHQAALNELREENKKIYYQNTIMTANISLLMGRLGVAPVDSSERRRGTDPHDPL